MARNERSQVQFDINITGAQNIKNLTQRLDKFLSKLRQVDKYQEKMQGGAAGGTTSGTRGSSKSLSKGDISNRMSQIKLGVRKGDIRSVKQMQGHYGRLVRELNRLEKEGKNVANMRLRAYKLNNKLTSSIREKRKAIQQTTQAKSKLTGMTNKARSSMMSNMGAMSFSQSKLRGATNQLKKSAGATKNASYTLLNMGYLIQDSPYGIRGMANNVSQLVQSYQMLGQQISMVNKRQGKNLTVWGQLGKMLKGPTGVMILLGSVLPAAIEYLSMYWGELTGSVRSGTEALEDFLEVQKEINKFKNDMRPEGADVMGLQSQRQERKSHRKNLKMLQKLKKEYKELGDLYEGAAPPNFAEKSDKQMQEIKNLKDELSLSGVDLETWWDVLLPTGGAVPGSLDKKIEDVESNIETATAQIEQKMEQMSSKLKAVEGKTFMTNFYEQQLSLMEHKAYPEEKEKMMMENIRNFRDSLDKKIASFIKKDTEESRWAARKLQKLKGDLAPDEEEEEDDEDQEPFDRSAMFEQRQEAMASVNEYKAWKDEQLVSQATTTSEKIKHIENKRRDEMRDLERQYLNGEFKTHQEFLLEKGKLENQYTDRIKSLKEDQAVFEIEMQKMTLKQGMDSADSFDEREQRIKALHEFKREQIRKTTDEGIERKKKLRKVDIEEEERITEAKKNERDKKVKMAKNYANAVIGTTQAIFQFQNKKSKAQFQIQKVASAARATVNTYESITAALKQSALPVGFRIPYAVSIGAFGFSKVAKILSQSHDSASSTGRVSGGGVGYRGMNFASNKRKMLGQRASQNQPYSGTSTGVNEKSSASKSEGTGKVPMEITDGYGNIVAKGNVNLDKQNRSDFGYWTK